MEVNESLTLKEFVEWLQNQFPNSFSLFRQLDFWIARWEKEHNRKYDS